MKRCPSFLKKTRHVSLNSSLYSTLCFFVVLLIFAFLAINCGPVPQGELYIPETENTTAEETTTTQSTQSEANLPESATVDLKKHAYIRNAFKQRPRVTSRNALDDFQTTTRRTVRHSAVIANCSFDVLKAFIANEWTPIVMIEFQGGSPEILPLSEYNDQSSMVSLQDPTNLTKRRLAYKDFEESWKKNSRNKCVLITPQKLTETDVQKVLSEFLPTEAFQEISMRSR
ncbi:MAG: hypothetical protein OXM61_10040 [Candidatus Poribacteria bacterium]|nr:hypothetical protein [Candidatus Poribacteria bacterium]